MQKVERNWVETEVAELRDQAHSCSGKNYISCFIGYRDVVKSYQAIRTVSAANLVTLSHFWHWQSPSCFRTEDASDSFMTESPSLSGFRAGLRIGTPPNVQTQGLPPERSSGRHQGQEWVQNSMVMGRECKRQAEWSGVHATSRPDHLPASRPPMSDKSTLKVYLPNGGFNVVKFGDATDIKVNQEHKLS